MRNDNLIRVIDALGEQIGERDRLIDIHRDEIARLSGELIKEREKAQQERKPAVYCADCGHCLKVEDSFQVYCVLYGIEFVSSNGCKLIDAEEFSCPKAKAREDAE